MKKRFWLLGTAALLVAACSSDPDAAKVSVTFSKSPPDTVRDLSFADIFEMQDDSVKARYGARNPDKTIRYFGIEPGMTVAEVQPSGGFYSKILLPYLGDQGELIGIDYSLDMWSKFGGFADEEFLGKRRNWAANWAESALAWRAGTQVRTSAFVFGSMPKEMKETADVVLFVRVLHHLNRWDQAYLDQALADVKILLKPGGVVGVVQHRSPEGLSDSWARGQNGYLKESYVIDRFEEAGFELVTPPESINDNPKDVPTTQDTVWRLPPTLSTSMDNPELKAKMEAIGESDRMTLLFRKK